jgi:hypothetical protein
MVDNVLYQIGDRSATKAQRLRKSFDRVAHSYETPSSLQASS